MESASIVDVPMLQERIGSIAVDSRYSKCRRLEDDYIILREKLGIGSGEDVVKVQSKHNEVIYAMKTLRIRDIPPYGKSEANISLMVDHPHIVKIVDVYETSSAVFLIMELLIGGDMIDRMTAQRHTEQSAAEASHQMLQAIAYLHDNGIVHHDIKPENWVYERPATETSPGKDHIKLIDFGHAKYWDGKTPISHGSGTKRYAAPEFGQYTAKADLWSFGVQVYVMLTHEMPFSEAYKNNRLPSSKEISAFHTRPPIALNHCSTEAQSFLKSLLKADPTERLSARDALNHPWLAKFHNDGESTDDEADFTMVKGRLLEEATSTSSTTFESLDGDSSDDEVSSNDIFFS
jgi:calcium-dependent protein kinase